MVNNCYRLLLLFFLPLVGVSQQRTSISLTEAYELSSGNYPVIKQKQLLRQTEAISIDNLKTGFLPQLTLSGQATYQSEVTAVPISLPGISIESPSKDQYKLLADVNQLIYDGGITREQKLLQQLNSNVEDQRIEVEMYRLKERINKLYLGILYLDVQLRQVDLVKADIQTGINRVEAQVNNGTAFRSNLNTLKAELLKADQRAIEIASLRKGQLDALSLYIGQSLPPQVQLEMPQPQANEVVPEITRPELKLFNEQVKLIGQEDRLITAKNLPRASLFAQGGYGRPGLNFLDNDFGFYYIGGVRFSWSLGGLYTKKKERKQVQVNQLILDTQKETFLLNTQSELTQQKAEIDKLEQLIASDKQIIELREQVKKAANAQLENAVITANDYLREVNAEDQARQALLTHELQLLQARINYQTISGK